MNVYLQSCRSITCILPVGSARAVLELLNTKKGITTAFIYHVRGVGMNHAKRSKLTEQLERDELVVLVPKAKAEEIFDYLYEVTAIDQPHHGLMYLEKVTKATEMLLSEV